MKIYKPIDGLLPGQVASRKNIGWLLLLGALLAGFFLYFIIVGGEVARERRADENGLLASRVVGHSSGLLQGALQTANYAARDRAEKLPPPAEKEPAVKTVATKPVTPKAEPSKASDNTVQKVAAVEQPKEGSPQRYTPGVAGDFAGEIKQGQTIYDALVALGFSASQIQPGINALSKEVDFRRTRPGDRFGVNCDKTGKVLSLRYQSNPESAHIATLASGAYKVSEKKVPLEKKIETVGGTVRSSLYKALRDLGAQHKVISQFIDIFSYDFNFANETKPGDTFRLVYEKIYSNGKFLRLGHVLAAEYVGKERSMRAYYYDDVGAYFDKSGQSLRRMFLRNPVKQARMTSKFGKRFHPILKKWMMHNGVDYAAPRGTPIYAIASGKATFVGRKGANGNLVAIRHANGMTSFYAHMQKFAPKFKVGKSVKQGAHIGYVGSTGRSTGPHLHLAIKSGGKFIDPLSVKSTRGMKLTGAAGRKYKQKRQAWDKKLNRIKLNPPSAGPTEPEPQGGDDIGDADVEAP